MLCPSEGTTPMPIVTPRALLEGRVAYAYVVDVAITIFDVPKWTDADVVRVMEETTRFSDRVVAKGSISQFYGEIFGSAHRKLILEWLAAHDMTSQARNALLTDSQLMRGALTAYAWLTQNETKAFEPRERDAICAWVTRGFEAQPGAVKTALEGCYRVLGKPMPGAERADLRKSS